VACRDRGKRKVMAAAKVDGGKEGQGGARGSAGGRQAHGRGAILKPQPMLSSHIGPGGLGSRESGGRC